MTAAMADELYERYRRIPHAELYRELAAGAPAQVTRLASSWRAVEDVMTTLASSLRRDLALLQASWAGAGADEYQHRLGLIATVAEQLAEEANAIRTGLGLMAGTLTEAQRAAEPEPTDGPEWTVDGVLGPALGHAVTAAERTRSHDRLAQVVAELAADYALARHQNWRPLPPIPPELPGVDAPGAVSHHGEHERDHQRDRDHDHQSRGSTRLAGLGRGGLSGEPVAAALTSPPPVTASPSGGPGPSLLTGAAGSTLAAAGTSHLASPSNQRSTAPDATPGHPLAGGASPMPMVGTGIGSVAPTDAGGYAGAAGFHRGPDGATSWSSGENVAWIDADDEPPPAVIGDTPA